MLIRFNMRYVKQVALRVNTNTVEPRPKNVVPIFTGFRVQVLSPSSTGIKPPNLIY